ncbi:hypothetical protein C8Q79DRAFT_928347 [Trametes meyenii]|nr:hypothetical protein C8Q79DRAFT_928347 [Trametes meyenii]
MAVSKHAKEMLGEKRTDVAALREGLQPIPSCDQAELQPRGARYAQMQYMQAPVAQRNRRLALVAGFVGSSLRHCIWFLALARNGTAVGRITHILTPAETSSVGDLVVLRQYTIPNSRHLRFNMPELKREPDDQGSILVAATDVLFIVSVQHNCRDSGCMASGRRVI